MDQNNALNIAEETANELRLFLTDNIINPVTKELQTQIDKTHKKLDETQNQINTVIINVSDIKTDVNTIKESIKDIGIIIDDKLNINFIIRLLWLIATGIVAIIILQLFLIIRL